MAIGSCDSSVSTKIVVVVVVDPTSLMIVIIMSFPMWRQSNAPGDDP